MAAKDYMKKIYNLAEIEPLDANEVLIRYDGLVAYVRNYGDDGFRFYADPFLSDWFDNLEKCQAAAIDYLFSNTDTLTLLKKLICLVLNGKSEWTVTHSRNRLTISTPAGHVAVVDEHLKVIHASDDDIQCSIYGFIESVKPYKKQFGQLG